MGQDDSEEELGPNVDGFAEKLPNKPLGQSAIEALDEKFEAAISPTMQLGVGALESSDSPYSNDLIIVTDSHVLYFSREDSTGWESIHSETYEGEAEFERVMEWVHEFSMKYSEQRMEDRLP